MANAADTTTTFAIDLQSNTAEVAKGGAAALEDLKTKIQGDIGALREMQKAMRGLQGASVVNIDAARKLREQMAAQKATIAANQAAFVNLGGAFKANQPESVKTEKLIDLLQKGGGRAGSFAGKIGEIGKALTGRSAALLAIAGATAAVTAATAAGIAVLAKYAVTTADARRSELLHLEGLTKMRFFWAQMIPGFRLASDSADFLQKQIDSVSATTALGRDQVAGYTEQLYKMGLRGGNLQAALEGVTTTAAVLGESQAQAFAQWAAGAAMTGRSVRALADDVKARLGGIAARQMLSLDVQAKKMRENFNFLFSSLKIEGLLKGLKGITDLFSASTAEGTALRQLIEVIFQPLIDQTSKAGPIVRRFFQGMILGAQQLVIWMLEIRLWFKKTFGASDILKGIDMQTLAVKAGAAAVGLLAAGLLTAAGAILYFTAPISAAIAAIIGIKLAVDQALKLVQEVGGWKAAGKAIVMAIGQGIADGTLYVERAIINVAKKAWTSFKDAIGMHSPPKLFVGGGFAMGHGTALGLRQSAPLVSREMQRVASPDPRINRAMFEAGVGGGSAIGRVESIRNFTTNNQTSNQTLPPIEVHIHGVTDVHEAGRAAADEVIRRLQGMGIAKGAKAA